MTGYVLSSDPKGLLVPDAPPVTVFEDLLLAAAVHHDASQELLQVTCKHPSPIVEGLFLARSLLSAQPVPDVTILRATVEYSRGHGKPEPWEENKVDEDLDVQATILARRDEEPYVFQVGYFEIDAHRFEPLKLFPIWAIYRVTDYTWCKLPGDPP